ncbi:major facilitator transporter [Haematobacter missouriensis]|uniref:MFS transporter n=1 Tax=Haematobacter missouriensis TaxID=366616 RepID=A0A212AYB6_9RHOB|nr:MFS transporter [Haematobacter missouriensis]KFI33184.1 major facilitator transporter [Haematobacter missouriensis]OWJ78667.1 MFS transporter [Haematobacter missouriensis]OWJ86454.1 MFS transporter [Haematobacter missouriensis]
MLEVLGRSWPLLFGVFLMLVGNGMQGTLLGIRGGIEGFTTPQMSWIMSTYFLGFLGGSLLAPRLIQRVGHVRVFAALGSLISALLILYPVLPEWVAWAAFRLLIGFGFSGVYVTAESWLNNSSTNETRGKALSLYMIMQSGGIIVGQGLLNVADPAGFLLFVIPSVLVSLSFTPVLLSVAPAPAFESTRPMSIMKLMRMSPLGCFGTFAMGGVFSALFGMASVWGGLEGLTVAQISGFVAAIYFGGLVVQYPIGQLSDRMDRRQLILVIALVGALVMMISAALNLPYVLLLGVATVIGGVANPLYSLFISHTNDYLDSSEMAAASGGLLFLNGCGAFIGPLITGWAMTRLGPNGFFLYIGVLLLAITLYTGWRMTRREAPVATGAMAVVPPSAGVVAMEAAMEVASEAAPPLEEETRENETQEASGPMQKTEPRGESTGS